MAKSKGSRKAPMPKRPPLTHFLCLPLVTPESKPQLQASLTAFREAISAKDPPDSIDPAEATSDEEEFTSTIHPEAIRPVDSLHCTLGVMSLTAEQLEEAVQLLAGLDMPNLIRAASLELGIDGDQDRPLIVDLKGLQSMHPPSQTSILYSAPLDATGRLLPFCLGLQRLFREKNLLLNDDRELKMHATVVNTIYAKNKMRKRPGQAGGSGRRQESGIQGHGPYANAPIKLDATAILERFKDFSFAENVRLDRVAICEMGAKKRLDAHGAIIDEEYAEVAHVNLPS